MAAIPVLHLQPLPQVADDALMDEHLTPGVEPGLVTQ